MMYLWRPKNLCFRNHGYLATRNPSMLRYQVMEKLVETLLDKIRYVCHYPEVKFYVHHGLKVRELPRVIVSAKQIVGRLHFEKHSDEKARIKGLWEKFLQIDEQRFFWKNYGGFAQSTRDHFCKQREASPPVSDEAHIRILSNCSWLFSLLFPLLQVGLFGQNPPP